MYCVGDFGKSEMYIDFYECINIQINYASLQ